MRATFSALVLLAAVASGASSPAAGRSLQVATPRAQTMIVESIADVFLPGESAAESQRVVEWLRWFSTNAWFTRIPETNLSTAADVESSLRQIEANEVRIRGDIARIDAAIEDTNATIDDVTERLRALRAAREAANEALVPLARDVDALARQVAAVVSGKSTLPGRLAHEELVRAYRCFSTPGDDQSDCPAAATWLDQLLCRYRDALEQSGEVTREQVESTVNSLGNVMGRLAARWSAGGFDTSDDVARAYRAALRPFDLTDFSISELAWGRVRACVTQAHNESNASPVPVGRRGLLEAQQQLERDADALASRLVERYARALETAWRSLSVAATPPDFRLMLAGSLSQKRAALERVGAELQGLLRGRDDRFAVETRMGRGDASFALACSGYDNCITELEGTLAHLRTLLRAQQRSKSELETDLSDASARMRRLLFEMRELSKLRPREPLDFGELYASLGEPAQLDGARRANAVFASVRSLGASTGEAFAVDLVNTSREPVVLDALGVVLEPVVTTGDELQTGLNLPAGAPEPISVRLVGYCLEQSNEVPLPGSVFRVADAEVQQRFEPARRILVAGRRLRDAGQLTPDGDPEAYFHSIRQWAVWVHEEGMNADSFADSWVENTRENVVAAGLMWTAEAESLIRGRAPGRWKDIDAILARAGLVP